MSAFLLQMFYHTNRNKSDVFGNPVEKKYTKTSQLPRDHSRPCEEPKQSSLQRKDVINALRLRQYGCHFSDDIFKCIFLKENIWISTNISLNFVPDNQINNIPALVQIIAWRRPDIKPLSEAMMFSLLTHICITRPQWVNAWNSQRKQQKFARHI